MASTNPAIPTAVNPAAIAASSPRAQSASRWFWWIAGLSVVNSVVLLSGGSFNFIVGLGITQFVDYAFRDFKVLAIAFDLVPVAFFVAAGFLARRGMLWAYIVGGIAYLLDGGIYAIAGEWLSVAFHAYALFCIFSGFRDLRERLQQARAKAAELPPVTPGVGALIAELPPQS